MATCISKWGNSSGIRIPQSLLNIAGLKVNDEVEISAEYGRIVINKAHRHKTLEERAAQYGGKLGPYEEFDFGDPVGREIF